ncbi:DUF5996 family protein [Anaeromyxobacter oryzae]|uniref:Ava_C0101 and related proteins n=1 Tax=Anaeromyxobacter oryzae TaxID=2918170 RepID=A0ABM7X1G9_9BACT|nr:DUF5996 family protein [Anaeromyxobacter oryzae]BDG05634.1 hypothetical protein AMOR_46300 [Anaeromyxobacter oryzae]
MQPEHAPGPWPELPLEPWRATRDALHMWTQIIGKTMLARCFPQNHWWHTALRVSARGLATPAPLCDGARALDVELDLVDHQLVIRCDGRSMAMPLGPRSVHSFYDEYLAMLRALGVEVHIWPMPVEVAHPVRFDADDAVREYDPAAAHRFWQVLRRCDATLRDLAGSYVGKQSPVQFFWGSFDLAYTRFSGRRAPERPGQDPVTREAYSHEVISFGFWPGGVTQTGVEVAEPVLYAYAAPEPAGFRDAPVQPSAAHYDLRLAEFILPYEAVRTTRDPAAEVRAFSEDVYDAGATLGRWDRAALERPPRYVAERGGAHPDVHPANP